jgi:hypothetical protein
MLSGKLVTFEVTFQIYHRMHPAQVAVVAITTPWLHDANNLSFVIAGRCVIVAQATPTKESTRPAADAAAPAKGSTSSTAAPAPEPALLPTGAPVDEPIELAWPPKRSFIEIILTKAVDTVEDIVVIGRRTLAQDLPG